MAKQILAERARILREAHCQAGTRHLRPRFNQRVSKMFRCERCKNTGKIQEQYADFGPLGPPSMEAVEPNKEVLIKWRTVECPECLGFGAAGWALPG